MVCKVSIIVPNYNHAKFLPQRLESIFNQTFQDFEVIILDDCSTDNSVDIINEYILNEKVSHFIINDKNSGSTFKQWQKGILLAKGKYIWIAESDDYCDSVFIEELLPHFSDGTGVVFCESNYVDNQGEIFFQRPKINKNEVYNGIDFIRNQMIFGNAINNASMAIFEKKWFFKIDQNSLLKMKYCGDWLFWSFLAGETNITKVFYPYNNFRRHDASVSNRSEKIGLSVFEGIKVFSTNLKYIDDSNKYDVYYFWAGKMINTKFNFKYFIFSFILITMNHPIILKIYLKMRLKALYKKFNYL